jgi:hypothetical protein
MRDSCYNISRSMCKKKVLLAGAAVLSTTDRLVHFCGPACYEQWTVEARRQDADDIRRAVEDGMQDLRAGKRPWLPASSYKPQATSYKPQAVNRLELEA